MEYNHNKLQNENGFTLVEILVAMGIFSLVISVTVGIFVGGSSSQKKIIELYDTQREASYLMETVSRELRMATKLCDNSPDCVADGRDDQQDNDDSEMEFRNYEGEWVTYCRSSAGGICGDSDDYFARDGEAISSSSIIIEDLTFYISETFVGVQPVVTIVMKVKSTGKYGTEFTLQNSIAMRLYE